MASKRLVAIISLLLSLLLTGGIPAIVGTTAASDDVSADWLGRVQRDIQSAEYEVTWQTQVSLPDVDAAWQAPNRAHGFRTYFTESGIRVVPRTEATPSWEWGLVLLGYGRGETLITAESPRLARDLNRLEYDRGAIREWYVNDERGLEQGFTIAQRPAGTREPLRIEMELTGDLRPVFATDGQAVDFATPEGPHAIHYAGLKVTDWRLREVPAHMEGFTRGGIRGIRIVMDDRDATYPITVDPLATSPAWTVEGNQTSASMGFAVSTAGDANGDTYSDVIVGADGYDNGQTNEGRIFVYYGTASGLPTSASWFAESNVIEARFGRTASTAGDVNGDGYSDILIGAQYYQNTLGNEGAVFVYHGSSTGLDKGGTRPSGTNLNADWRAFGGQTNASLGNSVASAGDVNADGYSDVIVAAWRYDNDQANEGRVYVHHGSASGLSASPSWTAESNQSGSDFGSSVATAGDVNGDSYADVIVGAWHYTNGQDLEGAAFVWHGSATGLGANGTPANADWKAESDQAYARLGTSVATAGNVNGDAYSDVVIGAWSWSNPDIDEGGVFVFHGSSTGLDRGGARPIGYPSSADWTEESDQGGARFGWSVSTAGDVNGDGYTEVVVGASHYDVPGKPSPYTDGGMAELFYGSSAGLGHTPWREMWRQNSAYFGVCVATAGDVNGDGFSDVLVGATGVTNGHTGEGAAVLYLGSPAEVASAAGWTKMEHHVNGQFGRSLAPAGDVNGDGYADVVVGAPRYDNGGADSGSVFVYYGSSSGLATSYSWASGINRAGAHFGWSVAGAGDVNGDGYDDILVGAPDYTYEFTSQGYAVLFPGSPSGLVTQIWSQSGTQANEGMGYVVAGAGDVNGDGYADVLINGLQMWSFYGRATGLPAHWNWADLGETAASAGDVNGDGYADIILGSGSAYNGGGQSSAGTAHVVLGSPAGLGASAWYGEGDQANAYFGRSVGTAGDVNGDGYSDIIVGAPGYTNGQSGEGKAFVYLGSASGVGTSASWATEGGATSAGLGGAVATAGDVNGDGYADVVVGASGQAGLNPEEGQALLFLGSGAGLSGSSSWSVLGGQAYAHLGAAVASAGDVNGDGYAEVLAGAHAYDDAGGWVDTGLVNLYYGNGGAGVVHRPRQLRHGDAEPIAEHGMSDGRNDFDVQLILRSPFGRSMAKLEYEAKPLGVLFDRSGLGRSADWNSTFSSGLVHYETVTVASPSAAYHWRVRVLYRPATSPFQQWSRWMTLPWGGWQEMRLRTYSVDADMDGYHDTEDCSDANANVWSDPTAEVLNLQWSGKDYVSWDPVTSGMGCLPAALVYDALRAGSASNFTSATCLDSDESSTSTREFSNPSVGQTWYYLVRADNACPGAGGPLGNRSNGTPRTGRACP